MSSRSRRRAKGRARRKGKRAKRDAASLSRVLDADLTAAIAERDQAESVENEIVQAVEAVVSENADIMSTCTLLSKSLEDAALLVELLSGCNTALRATSEECAIKRALDSMVAVCGDLSERERALRERLPRLRARVELADLHAQIEKARVQLRERTLSQLGGK